jgi:hypothetical protein
MSAAQIAHDRIKEFEQELREKDIAMAAMSAAVNGLRQQLSDAERDKRELNDQAKTLLLVAHQLGALGGEDVIKAVPMAVRQLLAERERLLDGVTAERDHITEHATHAARCQLINEIKAAFVPYDKLTAEQVIDLFSADKETADAE